LRENLAGTHKELWFHQYGDRSWLVVTRNTISHEITKVELATEVTKKLANVDE
jgi:heterotetrameric sarcosine oxidase delta subunit